MTDKAGEQGRMKGIRLDKYLAQAGLGSRTQVKELLKKGKVTVNGQEVRRPEEKVIPGEDTVCCGEETVGHQEHRYYLLNKPAGLVSATEDSRERTVLELFPQGLRRGIFPVGRLDKDTVGLLLLTDDGELAHRLLSPRKHVEKVYEALVDGQMNQEDQQAFAKGLDIGDDTPTRPARLELCQAGEQSLVRITLTEGRYHQVKRMCQAVGKPVIKLKRLSMGSLKLDDRLREGEYRPLTEEEIGRLKEC